MPAHGNWALPFLLLAATAGFAADFGKTIPDISTIKRADPANIRKMYTVRVTRDLASKTADVIRSTSAASTTVPLWGYSVTSPLDHQAYLGNMIGRTPFFNGHRTTTIQVYLVPVKLTFADSGFVFDPLAADACIGNDNVTHQFLQSPLVNNAPFVMNGVNVGSTQYVDAFQRANFWGYVAGTPYHTLLNVTTLPEISLSVPISEGSTYYAQTCGYYGSMDNDWWDGIVQNTLIPSLAAQGVGPTSLPIFLFDSVVSYTGGDPNNCCVLGYHGAYTPNNILQTYSVINYDTSGFVLDIGTASHEIAEWMDDPVGTNPTPAWGNIGQVQGCQNNLEVGDPLSGTYFPGVTLNGYTYNPQELAFFPWYFRLSPSFSAGGQYSDNATFSTGAGAVCH